MWVMRSASGLAGLGWASFANYNSKIPASTTYGSGVGSILAQRLRRWTSIEPTCGKSLVAHAEPADSTTATHDGTLSSKQDIETMVV